MPLGFSIIGSTVTFDLFLRWATQQLFIIVVVVAVVVIVVVGGGGGGGVAAAASDCASQEFSSFKKNWNRK